MIRIVGQFYLAPGAKPTSHFLAQVCFWNLGYHPSLRLACYHICSQNYGSKNKNWENFKPIKGNPWQFNSDLSKIILLKRLASYGL